MRAPRSTGALLLLVASLGSGCSERAALRVGSKSFTESVLLGEIATQHLADSVPSIEHCRQLGGSALLFDALRGGELDVYPEYTGTLRLEILARDHLARDEDLPAALATRGLRMTRPLGFNNTYILGMREELAEQRGITRISDLQNHPDLALAFSNEFMKREDGWPGLKVRYSLPHEDVRGIDHDIAYRSLVSGEIQVTDLYSTDAEIRHFKLRSLEDDRSFFPSYQALYLYRADLAARHPDAAAALVQLEGQIDAATMVDLNAQAKFERRPEVEVAAGFLKEALGKEGRSARTLESSEFLRYTWQHLFLVTVSLSLAILIAIPLGILASKQARVRQWILGGVGVLQTIPSLAILALMVSLLGFPIGAGPAVAALFLYSLLPIVRNTCAGLLGIPGPLRESALALGLPTAERLRRIELPLAAPTIFAGIKISAVLNVGTATLGTLIGAGGYGEPIWTGLRLQDDVLILQGAAAAAVMALALQGLFELLERLVVSKGLRL